MSPNKENKLVKREKVLYSGYVFVEVTSLGELQYVIKNTNGAHSLLKDRSGTIVPIPAYEIKRMSAFMKSEEDAISSTKFYKDEQVIITSGAFSTFKATITEVINGVKAKVVVLIFGRPTELEIDLLQLKKCTE
jgi:transcriptional antiterminator NusG